MKANELRIGNYLIKDGVVVMIDGRSIFDIWSHELGFGGHGYQRMQLTHEWVLRFGFIKKDIVWRDGSLSIGCYQKSWYYVQFDELIYFCKKSADNENIFLAHVTYVHELQNLYFSLTGQDLTDHQEPNPDPKQQAL